MCPRSSAGESRSMGGRRSSPGCPTAAGTGTPMPTSRGGLSSSPSLSDRAGGRVLGADKGLWPLVESFKDRVGFEHVVAVGDGPTPDGAIDYEELLATASADEFVERNLAERSAAAMCYTSGTTGQPKGGLYSHPAIALHP